MTQGYIHSIESMGTLDGPGIRTVVFFQGCPLKCKFCHNIDTNMPNKGTLYTVDELIKEIIKNEEYWVKNNGGVTLTGGEPFLQPKFLFELCKKLKDKKIHIAMDTCMETKKEYITSILPYVDLWMISLKELNEKKHIELTSVGNTNIIQNINYVNSQNANIRVRFLVIPTITDYDELITKVGEFVKQIKNLESIELLAYGTHGKDKWNEMFGKYELENIREANEEDLKNVKEKLNYFNLNIRY